MNLIEIKLIRGQMALVDDIDIDLQQHRWYLGDGYARYTTKGSVKIRKQILLHRVILQRIMGRPLGRFDYADHINMNRLDNRRTNLRLATPRQNQMNRPVSPKNKSGYKGVSTNNSRSNAYSASIRWVGGHRHIGSYSVPEEAAWMYDQWALCLHGDFARLNFDYYEVAL